MILWFAICFIVLAVLAPAAILFLGIPLLAMYLVTLMFWSRR